MSELHAMALDGQRYPVERSDIKWRPSAYGIVIENDAILLSPQHGLGYDLPGGGMEFGEDFEQAVIREVKEETGIDVAVKRLVDVRTMLFVWKPDDLSERSVQQSIMFYYLCEKVGGELSTEGFDREEQSYAQLAEWVSLTQFSDISLASTVDFRSIVAEALKQ